MIASTLRAAVAAPAFARCASASAARTAVAPRSCYNAAVAARTRTFASSSYQLARRFTKEHEWADLDKDSGVATVGITLHAANQLGDIVFVELPKKGTQLEEGAPFGTIESVKAVSELYAPLSGTIEAINEELKDDPEVVNSDPDGE
ncbi:hypothetical protein OC842_004888, partial [Tilletia horrida]